MITNNPYTIDNSIINLNKSIEYIAINPLDQETPMTGTHYNAQSSLCINPYTPSDIDNDENARIYLYHRLHDIADRPPLDCDITETQQCVGIKQPMKLLQALATLPMEQNS